MARKVIIRRGLKDELPQLDIGELGYTIDSEELFIGSGSGNVLFAKKSELQTLIDDVHEIKQSAVFTRLGVSENGLLTIDGIEQQLGGGNGDMALVVKDYFEGSTNITKTYTDNMVGFSISNDAGVAGGTLTFTINGITIPVKATESYEANFLPFKTVTINTTVPYRATVATPYGATFDTIAPLNVTGLTATNVTTSDLTLSWIASTSSDTAGYEVYRGSTLLATITETTYNVTGLNPSTSYTFTIKAKDNSGNVSSGTSITTSTLADTTPPNNVTNLVASNILATSLSLSWTASTSTDTVGYDVYKGSTLLTTVTGTAYNVTGLTSNTNYTFTIKAKDGFNNIASGASISVKTADVDTTPPSDVTGLAAGTPTVNSIPVGWTLSSSSDVANYEIAYSSNGGSTWTIASSLINNNSTSYTITGLVSGTTYTIRVVAIDTSGNRSTGVTITKATASSASYTVSATPSSGTYNATQNVTLSVVPSGATIYYTTNGSTPTTSSSVYNSPIAVSTNTTIKFFAQDGSGNATSVQTATYTIDTVAPVVTISPVAGTYNATQSVTITSNEGTIYYTVDGTTPTVSSTVYSTPISVSATQTIKYLVVDAAGNQTTGSAVYTIDVTSPDPVKALALGTVTYNSIPITWTAPDATDVSKYEVAYSSNGGTTYTIATSSLSIPATNYTVTGLIASTTYTIRVVAIDGAGNRSMPATVTTTTSALSTDGPNHLSFNNTAYQYISVPSMTFDEIVVDAKFPSGYSVYRYPIGGGGNSFYTRTPGDTLPLQTYVSTGTLSINGTFAWNTRNNLDLKLSSAITSNFGVMAKADGTSQTGGDLYKISVYNAGTLVALYDFTTQFSGTNVVDKSGNGHNATIMGSPTWV
ncbi:fibronectin type III domain-containing protein [Bacillus xiapuensis]|uniref:Fibronectin type III domain-containing protein n=1 Tax=Bacillus xiapuensis TaxID=2014075 RepID=A0ABU6N8L4_9BACI|nr:fibronectin type III domain-containing protein [Bacillus xiapuensis]